MKRAILASALLTLAGCSAPSGPTLAHGKPVEHWVQALHDPSAKVRKRAAQVLGNVGATDPAIVHALAGALRDRDRNVREAAVVALLKMGPAAKDATPALTDASRDSDAKVRGYAARALQAITASHTP